MTKQQRGIFERPRGSGTWWICYFAAGKRHREKVGTREAALAAYHARKKAIREGRFFAGTIRSTYGRSIEQEILFEVQAIGRKVDSLAEQIAQLSKPQEQTPGGES